MGLTPAGFMPHNSLNGAWASLYRLSLMTMTRDAIVKALKEGRMFQAACAEDNFWKSWQLTPDGDVMNSRGWGKVGHGAEFESPELASLAIASCMKSARFKVVYQSDAGMQIVRFEAA